MFRGLGVKGFGFGFWGLRNPQHGPGVSHLLIFPIVENQMEKKTENETEMTYM